MTETSRTYSAAILVAVAISAAFTVLFDTRVAHAFGYLEDGALERGYVIARSRHGNGSVSGRVRGTRLGAQVQLPGGNWEYCRHSCSETLRVETVDFWEDRSDTGGGLAAECGIFGCLDIGIGRRGW